MAKQKRELEINLTTDEWKKWKMLTNKSACRCYKDPSEVFLLGLNTACNAYK